MTRVEIIIREKPTPGLKSPPFPTRGQMPPSGSFYKGIDLKGWLRIVLDFLKWFFTHSPPAWEAPKLRPHPTRIPCPACAGRKALSSIYKNVEFVCPVCGGKGFKGGKPV